MASDTPFISSVDLWPCNFNPMGWMFCQGQQMSIPAYSALYALLGVTYGGNGSTYFNLPDLRGRVPIGAGQGPGLSNFELGKAAGQETVTLTTANLPAHNHAAVVNDPVYSGTASGSFTPRAGTGKITTVSDPTNNYPAQTSSSTPVYTSTNSVNMGASPVNLTVSLTKTTAGTVAIGNTGNNASFNIHPPYLPLNYIIAIAGIFPPRD